MLLEQGGQHGWNCRLTSSFLLTGNLAGTQGLLIQVAVFPQCLEVGIWGLGWESPMDPRPDSSTRLLYVTMTRSQPKGRHRYTRGTPGSVTLTDALTRRHVRPGTSR